MKNKLFISIYCGLMILLASCNNYLDVKPKGKIIPETAEDFSTIIHYWLDQIEKGRDDVIIPNPEVMTTLEMFADNHITVFDNRVECFVSGLIFVNGTSHINARIAEIAGKRCIQVIGKHL